jgi:hypothetical protein
VSRYLFAVTQTYRLAIYPGELIVAADCLRRSAPSVAVGQSLEFRNPGGTVTQAVAVDTEVVDSPDLDSPFSLRVRPHPPGSPVEVGATAWAAEGARHAEHLNGLECQ